MHLSDDDIASIATWSPIDDAFAGVAEPAIAEVLSRITETDAYTHDVFETGGLSNYVAFLVCHSDDLVHRPSETYRQLAPVAVNLSLCAPVGVIGRTRASYGTEFCGVDHLDIADIFDPSQTRNALEQLVVEIIADSPFDLLSPNDVMHPLPNDVTPYEYCLVSEPWDRYFHALFANTD